MSKKLISVALAAALLILTVPLYSFAYEEEAAGDHGESYVNDAEDLETSAETGDDPGDDIKHDTEDSHDSNGSSGDEQPNASEEAFSQIAAPEQSGMILTEGIYGLEEMPAFSVLVPESLDFTIDPFEVTGRGQVFSDEHVFENLGDSAVAVVFTYIAVTLWEEAGSIALRQEPFPGGAGGDENELYLIINFGRPDIEPAVVTAPFGEPVAIPLYAYGDESGLSFCALSISGNAGLSSALDWESGDVGLTVTIEIEPLDETGPDAEEINPGAAGGLWSAGPAQGTQGGEQQAADTGNDGDQRTFDDNQLTADGGHWTVSENPEDTEAPDDTENADDNEAQGDTGDPDDNESSDDDGDLNDNEGPDNNGDPDDSESPDDGGNPDDAGDPEDNEDPGDMKDADDVMVTDNPDDIHDFGHIGDIGGEVGGDAGDDGTEQLPIDDS